ncbi:hypothetical protein ACHAWU_002520 [Discostella pseudostelligera]|uniref:Uncharacterized protein n=1 Tax=Discostella pseudostelligera TaxID=259834 RepID=A0ABD3N7W6_9STRA
MMMSTTMIPSFEVPHEDSSDDDDEASNNELWLLRAPAHMDVAALLNGVTLDVDSQMLLERPQQSNRTSVVAAAAAANTNILARFKPSASTSTDGSKDEREKEEEEYALILDDARELDILRLLVPDNTKKNKSKNASSAEQLLVPYSHPFQRQIHLTSVVSCGSGTSNNINPSTGGDATNNTILSNIKSEMILAPPPDTAPPPALNTNGNGSVDAMRLAYIPVPQRSGMKRRWTMPGGGGAGGTESLSTTTTTSQSMPKKARVRKEEKDETAEVDMKEDDMVINKEDKKGEKKKKKEKKKGKKSN